MFTTEGPTAVAASAIEFLLRNLESSELPPEPWLLRLVGGTNADATEFIMGNPPCHGERRGLLERSPVEAVDRRWRSGVEADTVTAVVGSQRSRRPPAPAAAPAAARRRVARRGFRNILESGRPLRI